MIIFLIISNIILYRKSFDFVGLKENSKFSISFYFNIIYYQKLQLHYNLVIYSNICCQYIKTSCFNELFNAYLRIIWIGILYLNISKYIFTFVTIFLLYTFYYYIFTYISIIYQVYVIVI